jgi:hypothetical protein
MTSMRDLDYSVHLSDEVVDISFPVTKVTTLHIVLKFPCPPTASGVGKLEGPKEVGGLLEIGSSSDDFVDEIFNAEYIIVAKVFLNDGVVAEGDALLVNFAVTSFVNQFTD